MPNFCMVLNCGSNGMRDKVGFYRIPSGYDNHRRHNHLSKERRNAWIKSLRRADLSDTKLKNGRICSKHFISGKPAPLFDKDNPDWVPSVKLGYKSAQSRKGSKVDRYGRLTVRYNFRFPVDDNEKAVWLEKLGLKEFNESVSKYTRICSTHFERSFLDTKPSGKIFLRKGARPLFFNDDYILTTKTASTSRSPMKIPIFDASTADHCFRDNDSSITIEDDCSPTSRDNNLTSEIKVEDLEPITEIVESNSAPVAAPTFVSRSKNFQDMFQRKVRHEILTDIARERMQLQGSSGTKPSTRSSRLNSSKQNETELQKLPAEPSRSNKSPVVSRQRRATRGAAVQVFSTNTPEKGRPPLSTRTLPLSSTENTPNPLVTQSGLVFFSPPPVVVNNSSVMSHQNPSQTSVISQNAPQALVHLPQTLPNTNNPLNSFLIIPQSAGATANGLFLLPQNLQQQNIILPPLTLLSSQQQTGQFSVGPSNNLHLGELPRITNTFTVTTASSEHPRLGNSFTNTTASSEHTRLGNSFTNIPASGENTRHGNSFANTTASWGRHVDSSITCQLSNSSTDTASETGHFVHKTSFKAMVMEDSYSKCSSKGKKSRCRTCLDPVPNQVEQASISMACFEGKTVKEGLVQLLPEMDSTLCDDQFVCAKCFMLLRNTLKFIKTCLDAESVIAKDLKNNSKDVPGTELIEDGYHIGESDIREDVSLGEDIEVDAEENDSAFEIDPNVEEEDYVLNGITNLIRGSQELKNKNFSRKQTDLKDAVIKHLNFLPLQHAKVSNHNSIVSIREVEPEFIFSLQQNKIRLLQNCSKFDENMFTNKRVLLLGGHTEIKCLLCEEHFNTEAKMQNHISDVHGLSKAFLMETYCYQYKPGSSNICEACGKDCGNAVNKKVHLKSCYVFPCPYCDELFTSGQLPNHTSAEHDDPKPFKCVRCKQEKVDFVKFKSHLCNALICEKCGKHYLDKNQFRLHTAKCSKSEDGRRKCTECKERFVASSFLNHIKTHKIPCSICGKIFHRRRNLRKHENSHRLKKRALCPLCGKIVASLKQHMRVHDKNRMKKAKCFQCPSQFFDKANLTRHISIHHAATKIVCAKCGILCYEDSIENHYDSQHPHETVFNCAQCEATFTRIAFLKQHAKSHASELRDKLEKQRMERKAKKSKISRPPRSDTGFLRKLKMRIKAPDAPVTCKYCLKTLKGLLHYRRHLDTHLELYRYKCRFCEMTYSSQTNKNRHEKLHKKPNYKFRCNECWKIMSCQEELDAHMAHHADKPKRYQCGECSELFCREYQLRSHLINKHTDQGDLDEARDKIIKDAFMDFAVESDN